MTNPEIRSVGLDDLAPWDEWEPSQHDSHQIANAETRELAAYAFDSDDETLVGVGDSGAAHPFSSSDRTLVGIGPVELAERARRARDTEEACGPDVAMPQSEPPGPFIASDADEAPAPTRLPLQRGVPWVLALPALLVAAAGVVVVRGVMPRATASGVAASAVVEAPESKPELAEASSAKVIGDDERRQAEQLRASLELPPSDIHVAPASDAKQSAPPPPAVSRATPPTSGSLDIASIPPSNVVLDGRPLGKVPRVVQVAPGPHTVVFVHPERGRMSLSVNVSAGRTTSASANF